MKNSMRLLGLAGILAGVFLGGCGDEGTVSVEDVRAEVELREPGKTAVGIDAVTFRNLYAANVYEGVVCPYVEEYSFDANQIFDSYGAFPGDTVKRGQVLVRADKEALSEQIGDLQKQLDDLREEFEKFREKTEKSLSEQRGELERLQQILDNLEEQRPEKTHTTDQQGQEIPDPAYESWKREQNKWQGEYNLKEYYIDVAEEELSQKEELYLLDHGYYSAVLADLREQDSGQTVTSRIAGVVVAEGLYAQGDRIRENTVVAAVADMGQKVLKCGRIPWRQLTGAAEAYALIDGVRYSVVHSGNDDGFTSFAIEGESDSLRVGASAVLVLISDVRRQVLTVPNDALFEDESGQCVHLLENGQYVSRQVQTGMSDGVYTEVLSGLKEGDRVASAPHSAGSQTAVLEKGTFQASYAGTGYIIFPVTRLVRNPVEKGTVIFRQSRVRDGQWVEQGDVLLSVRVEIDDMSLAAKENSLKRARERLADLEAREEEKTEAVAEVIAQRKERILEQEKEIALIRADAAVTEIRAPISGYAYRVTSLESGDAVAPKAQLYRIEPDSPRYLVLENAQDSGLNYGDILAVRYANPEGEESVFEGRVLNLGKYGMTSSLSGGAVIVSLPEDIPRNILSPAASFTVSGSMRQMADVVLVPAKAVTQVKGQTYVNVLQADGSQVRTSFLAGGMAGEFYWVIDGLTEGMKICWE